MQANVYRSPEYLAAGSMEGLRRLMLERNLRDGVEYRYFDIQFAQGKWVAWFYVNRTAGDLVNGDESRARRPRAR